MKSKSTFHHCTRTLSLIMFIGLLITQTSLSAANVVFHPNLIHCNNESFKKNTAIISISHSNPSVKIYRGLLKKSMHVIAKKNNRKSVDFFVFDLEGTLMKNFKMKAKDHIKISGLKKGSYIYRVFCGDEETASGSFEIL